MEPGRVKQENERLRSQLADKDNWIEHWKSKYEEANQEAFDLRKQLNGMELVAKFQAPKPENSYWCEVCETWVPKEELNQWDGDDALHYLCPGCDSDLLPPGHARDRE